MSQELQTVTAGQLASPMELTPEYIVHQVRTIQSLMGSVMKVDEHFGVIPGCKKPSLYKSGAEKLSLMFRLAPEYIIHQTELAKGHRDVSVTCNIKHIGTGAFLGSGVGSCSTMEAKYRWRNAARKCPNCGKEAIIKGKAEYGGGWLCFDRKGGCKSKWPDGAEEIEKQENGRIENEDIADQYNTVLKMAKKRAHVDAILTVTAASDIFTQDVEDLPPIQDPVKTEPTKHETGKPKNAIESVAFEVSMIEDLAELKVYADGLKKDGGQWWNKEIYDIVSNRIKQLKDAEEIRAMERAH